MRQLEIELSTPSVRFYLVDKVPMAETKTSDSDEDVGRAAHGGRELTLEVSGWSRAAARSFLRFRFGDRDRDRLSRLEAKAAQTALTPAELAELEGYREVTAFLEAMKRSAREYLIRPEAAGIPLGSSTVSPASGRSRAHLH